MSTTKEIYAELFAGKRLTISVPSKRAYMTLRSHLHVHHRLPYGLELTDKSLCGDYNADSKTATFWLGESRRSTGASWTVLDSQEQSTDE